MYWLSANVIKADEDKTYLGAFVASPTDPWGQLVPATTTLPWIRTGNRLYWMDAAPILVPALPDACTAAGSGASVRLRAGSVQ